MIDKLSGNGFMTKDYLSCLTFKEHLIFHYYNCGYTMRGIPVFK